MYQKNYPILSQENFSKFHICNESDVIGDKLEYFATNLENSWKYGLVICNQGRISLVFGISIAMKLQLVVIQLSKMVWAFYRLRISELAVAYSRKILLAQQEDHASKTQLQIIK